MGDLTVEKLSESKNTLDMSMELDQEITEQTTERPIRGTTRVNYASLHSEGLTEPQSDTPSEEMPKEDTPVREAVDEEYKPPTEEEYTPPVVEETDSEVSFKAEELVNEANELMEVEEGKEEKPAKKRTIKKRKK